MIKRWLIIGCLAILALQTFVQVRLASLDSQTTDEAVHLSAGYTYLTKADFRFNPEHPPLVKVLAALPLLYFKPHITPESETLYAKSDNFFFDSWRENRDYGEKLMYQSGNNPDQMLFWARLPIVALTFILGLLIFFIAWRHWGEVAAITATAMYAFNPTVNGHGHLVTTDIAVALGFLLTIYTCWRLLEKPVWKWSLGFGLAFGFALLSKHTAIILIPAIAVLMIWRRFDKTTKTNWRLVGQKFIVGLLITWALIWVGYGFHSQPLPKVASATSAAEIANSAPANPRPGADHAYNIIRPILSLLPGDYVKGVFMVITHASGGHDSYLLGQTSKTGWWYYFPVLLFTKTPLAELLLIGAGLTVVFKARRKDKLAVGFTIAGLIYFLVALDSKADLGIRHIMPVFPVIFLAASYGLSLVKRWRPTMIILLVWLALVFGLSWPTYLGYFNELVGGSGNGYKIATDSNLDWGQDLKRIQTYAVEHPNQKFYIDYGWDGRSALDYYLGANNYQPIDAWEPGQSGYAIIGASAYNQSRVKDYCVDPRMLTSGVFTCLLRN